MSQPQNPEPLEPLNPEQREAVESTEGPLLIIAGAGSGKTRVITERVVHLLRCGTPMQDILALTFTNKAAREMRERIRAQIANYGKAVQKLNLFTFHSFGLRLLQQNAPLLGYSANFSIYDAADAISCLREAAAALQCSTDFQWLK